MPLVRALVQQWLSATAGSRDWCVNTVYHTIGDAIFNPSVDYQNHANQIRDCFVGAAAGHSTADLYSRRKVVVKVYNMADATPRPIQATATYTPSSYATSYNPRILALCLSFYSGRNIKGKRGRIYMGPFDTTTTTAGEVASYGTMNRVLETGHALFDVGGENVAHVIRHSGSGGTSVVSDYWCNEVWDVQHSRELAETSRVTLHP